MFCAVMKVIENILQMVDGKVEDDGDVIHTHIL